MLPRILMLVAFGALVPASAAQAQVGWSLSHKECGRCGRQVDLSSAVGGVCPYPDCGAYWGAKEKRYIGHGFTGKGQGAASSKRRAADAAKKARKQPPKVTSTDDDAGDHGHGGGRGDAPNRAADDERVASATGKYVLQRARDGLVYLRENGVHVLTFAHDGELHRGQFSPDENHVVAVSGGSAFLYSLPKGNRTRISIKNTSCARFVDVRQGQPTIAIFKPGFLYFMDTDGQLCGQRITARRGSDFHQAIFTTDAYGRRVFTIEADGHTAVHALQSSEAVAQD